MELRVLRYFLAVAREENISRAAEALYITQPTLSRQLAELEEELGTPLFVRGKRKISLTEEGILLRRRAEEMVELESRTEEEFRNLGKSIGGTVSIGAAEAKAAEILPRAIVSFREKYPDVTFDLYSDIADHVRERLDRGLLDIGLLVEPGEIGKYEFLRLGVEDKCGILMNANSELAKKDHVTVEDLQGLPVIANRRASVRDFYRQKLGKAYDRLNVVATFNLINNAALFAVQNCGYVFTIEGALANYQNPALAFRPFYPEFGQSAFIVWKKYQPMTRAAGRFLEEIRMLSGHENA